MSLLHRHDAIIPLHIPIRSPIIQNLETTKQVRDHEVQFRVRDINPNTRPRASRERDELILHFPQVAGGICQPALRPECIGIVKGMRIVVVDIATGGDECLER